MSRRSPRLYLRFVAGAALLSCLVSTVPFYSQVHAATQPQTSAIVPLSRQVRLGRGTFTAAPGTTISVGSNGVISVTGPVTGTAGPVQVVPNSGYVLARFNPTTGQWEAVPDNTIRPGTGTYALIAQSAVAHITSLSVQLASVSGGRTAQCSPAHNRQGNVLAGCQIVTLTAPVRAGSHLYFTVRYPAAPQLKQYFVATANASGHYQGAFPVMYNPPAGARQGAAVTVTMRVSLRNYSYWGTASRSFVAMPARGRRRSAPRITSMSLQLAGVRGGRSAQCRPAHNRQGNVLAGCQIVTLTAPIRPWSHLYFTVRYPAAPQLKQYFVATADARGHYIGAFPVMYNPPAGSRQGAAVTVTMRVDLRNYSYWGTATRSFMAMPARGRRQSAPHITSMSLQLAGVRGGRSAQCSPAHDQQGHVLAGCQIVTLTAPIRPWSHLYFTVRYPSAPQLKQYFVATANASGHYIGALPVMYNPPTSARQGVPVTVTMRVDLRGYSYWGTATRSFMAMPARG